MQKIFSTKKKYLSNPLGADLFANDCPKGVPVVLLVVPILAVFLSAQVGQPLQPIGGLLHQLHLFLGLLRAKADHHPELVDGTRTDGLGHRRQLAGHLDLLKTQNTTTIRPDLSKILISCE